MKKISFKIFILFFLFLFNFFYCKEIKADYVLDENYKFGAGGIGFCRTAASTDQGSYMYYIPNTDLYVNQISFIGSHNTTPTQNIDITLKIQNATTSPTVYCTSYYTQNSGSTSGYIRTFNFDNCKLENGITYWLYMSGVCYTGYTGGSLYNSTSVKSNSGYGIINSSNVWYEGTGDYAYVINGNYNLSGGSNCGDCICSSSGGGISTTSTTTLMQVGEFLDQNDISKISSISGTDDNNITYTVYNIPNLLFKFIFIVFIFSVLIVSLLLFFRKKL